MGGHLALLIALTAGFLAISCAAEEVPEVIPKISDERVVFVLDHGDIEFAFFPEIAPVTSAHIFQLCTMGLYTSNNFFRVDKGFVAQTSDVTSRTLPMSAEQREIASKTVPLEVVKGVRHHEGVVSMARGGDPHSGSSSFFIMFGSAPHLDMQYGAFGRVTRGLDVLHKLETLPTKREGIFVMPLERITIVNTYWYRKHGPLHLSLEGQGEKSNCADEVEEWKIRFQSQAVELQNVRKKCLPGS